MVTHASVSVQPYSGGLRTLPLRNRSSEGVAARAADAERRYGTMEDAHVLETPVYDLRERRGWVSLILCAEFGGTRVALYSCPEGARCDLADAPAFRASVAEALR